MNETTKKTIRPRKIVLIIVCVLLGLLLCLTAAYFIMKAKGAKKLREELAWQEITAHEDAELEDEGKYVTYKGKKYQYNEDLITILFMGVDKELEETGRTASEQTDRRICFFWRCLIQRTERQRSFIYREIRWWMSINTMYGENISVRRRCRYVFLMLMGTGRKRAV